MQEEKNTSSESPIQDFAIDYDDLLDLYKDNEPSIYEILLDKNAIELINNFTRLHSS